MTHAASPSPMPPELDDFTPDEIFARRLDEYDPLAECRDRFHIPRGQGDEPVVYLCGNSLGLQPRTTAGMLARELSDWAELGVEGHFHGRTPWYTYHEVFREPGARLVGARPHEVVMMNSLTVNLHLMMVSFFRPTAERNKILMEWPVFPSDIYAIKTHLRTRGLDPDETLVIVRPREGEHAMREADVEAALEREGDAIALVLLAGVNFFTGQVLDIPRLTAAAHAQGCIVGWDLAHAAGNVELSLHDWNVDFACWCSYKYLNSGPGAIAGCFVHERHGANTELVRYGGWWGNDPDSRFKMHLQPDFVPRADVDGWQVSNPPILAMVPLRASLEIFDEIGMPTLRAKSLRMTTYLRRLIETAPGDGLEIITPSEPERHGSQLSILVHDRPRERFKALERAGVVCDFREPNVVRVAPVPLYNTYHDAWRFAHILATLET